MQDDPVIPEYEDDPESRRAARPAHGRRSPPPGAPDVGAERGGAEVGAGGGRAGEAGRGFRVPSEPEPDSSEDVPSTWPSRSRPRTRRRVRKIDAAGRVQHTAQQRLLILDTWIRSKLSAREFAEMVDVSSHTLYKWKSRFEAEGPAGLVDQPRGGRGGSRLSEVTRRAIVMLKEAHPDWGEQRIHDVLVRTEGYGASPGAIGRVLAAGSSRRRRRSRTRPR